MTVYSKKKEKNKPDYVLICIIFLLVIFGIIMLTSAGAPVGYERFGDSYYYLKHQVIYGLIPGIIVCLIMSKIKYTFWKKFAVLMLFVSIVLLTIVFIPGIGSEYGTAKSWINIGGLSLQPSEIVKLTFLIYLATWLEKRGQKNISDFFYGFLPFIFLLGLVTVLMLLQPDMGTMLIIVAEILIVYFIAGGAISHLLLLGSGGLALLYFLIKLAPYRAARLTIFMHPELDPKGIGYHINQAFLAIGSGGIWGRGYGHSRQKFQYLPEVIGDSIFAIIAEEMGFIICIIVIILFVLLFIRGLKIAKQVPDMYGKLIVVGIISWFLIQAFVNIGGMVGLLPLTGVPLPFISAGGTSLLVSLAAVGLVINISKHAR